MKFAPILSLVILLFCRPAAAQSALVESTTFSETANADLVLRGGNVKTVEGWAEAVAVRDGIIIALGDDVDVSPYIDKSTDIVELSGNTVMPGLHDMHVHPLFAGLEQIGCSFPPGAAAEVIVAAVARCVEATPPGNWIQGGNWVAAAFERGQQTRQLLDSVAPDHPVLLNDEAHHSLWVNSKALELAGITRDTPDPQGGIIERDSNGEPNGLLRETAVGLVFSVVPPATTEEKRAALKLASDTMASYGITSYTIASVRKPEIGDFSALSDSGVIRQRVRGCLVWVPAPTAAREASEALIASRNRYAGPNFKTDCIKMFLDGVPTESQTAAMLEPYLKTDSQAHGHGHDRPESGILMVPQDTLNSVVADFDRQGLHIKFHVVGDAAVRAAIDAVEYARGVNGTGGPMHDLGHNSFVAETDIPRVRDLNMAWEFSPYIWYPTPIAADDIARVVGQERMQRWIPIKDALATGALVVVGSDWSVVPSVNPWLAIETLVTRQRPGGSEDTLGAGQRIPLTEAYQIFTENGARLMGHRNQTGSIEVGMRADFVVTARNLFDMPLTEIHRMPVVATYIDGNLIYEAEK